MVLATMVFLALSVNYFRLAFAISNLWVALGLLFPPSCIAFYAIFAPKYRLQALFHGVGFMAVVLFTVLYVRTYPFEFDQTRLAQFRDWVAPAFSNTPLAINTLPYATDAELEQSFAREKRTVARLNGIRVKVKQVVFNHNILRFKSLSGFGGATEIAIDLANSDIPNPDNIELVTTPESADLPTVIVHTKSEKNVKPSATSYNYGFWLELKVEKINESEYDGFVNLKLPDGQKSYLAGHFVAQKRDLVWEHDGVDRNYDSNDTIEYVAEKYLANKLGSSLVEVKMFNDTYFQTGLADASGRTLAHITLVDGSDQNIELRLFKGEFGWAVEHTPVRDLIAALRAMTQAPTASIGRQIEASQTTSVDLGELESVVGEHVILTTKDGKVREGTIKSVDRYNVSLSIRMGGGSMAMLIRRRHISDVRIQE